MMKGLISRGWDLPVKAAMLALGISATGCDRTTVNEAAGNTEIAFDVTGSKAVNGQDVTINRIRVMKSTSNSTAPGAASIRDNYYVDVWATLSGESKPRKGSLGPFLADDDGNLYSEDAAPGTLFYNTDIVGDGTTGVGTEVTYEVTAKDGLIKTEWDKYVEVQTTLTDSGARTNVKRSLTQVSTQNDAFANIRKRTYSSGALFSRTRYQQNTDFAVKGKLGCFNKTTAASGDTSYAEKPTFYDVELGSVLSDKDGTISSTKASTDDSSANDQILWIKWSENWYVTGININTRAVRMVRERAAPFYMNRELPQRVITTAAGGSPNPSGIEKMIRSCSNDVKATSGSKNFTTVGFAVTGTTYTSFTRLNGTGAGNCAGTENVANTVALTTAFSGGATVFTGCTTLTNTTFGLSVGAGTWDGTKSAGILSAVTTGTLTHLEHTAIEEMTF